MEAAAYLRVIQDFINEVGISCTEGAVPADSFLPGILIREGGIVFDPAQLLYPGDLLHEAGHLAVLSPADRQRADGSENLSGDIGAGASEMAAIAWSWAAKEHTGVPAEVLFHDMGYKGGAQSLRDNFSQGRYFGVPMLQWLGMTREPRRGGEADAHTYPGMAKWLRC